MRVWINEICSTLPFQVTLAETKEGDWSARQNFATEAEAKAFARGLCQGFAACAMHLPSAPTFLNKIERLIK